MSGRTLRKVVAAVAVTAAVVTAGTGCGGEDPQHDRRSRTAVSQSAVPSAKPDQPSAPADATRRDEPVGSPKNDGAGKDRPTVPKARLTPATGSFTEKQKEYLTDRVPRGTDPAAVLQAGQAVCDRIGRTAEVDREAAVDALRSGEIAEPEPAVAHLCPEYRPLLEAAGLGDG